MPRRLFVENCAIVRAPDIRQLREVARQHPPAVRMVITWPDGRETPLDVAMCATVSTIGPPKLWFACPACGRRVGCLYSPSADRPFACRHCWQLKYECQYPKAHDLALDLLLGKV